VILPSGHTPPNSPGGSQPNEAEIPAHLRPLFLSMAEIPIPTPGPEQATQIQIAAINVDAPIVQGDSWEQLKKGVGQYIGSADPGQPGNMVLSAHNDVYGEIFRHLDELQPGDQIIIFTLQHSFTYMVSETQIVKPTDVEVMASTPDPTLTLISCYPYMIDNKRIIVRATLEKSEK
jgi:sortase A